MTVRYILILMLSCTLSCSDNVILNEALAIDETPVVSTGYAESGDIFIVSGGITAPNVTPFPLHNITQWSADGTYIRTVAQAPITTTFFYGADLSPAGTELYHTIETVDRIEAIDLTTLITTTHILDANLSGATMRAMAVLSDGSMIAAESTTSIEKYTAAGVRVAVGFPLVVTANVNSLKRISGNRFAVMISGNPDNVRIYSNAGALQTSLTGPACNTNCDPYDILELADGRFVVSNQVSHALELYSSAFTYIGQLYLNTSVMITPGALAQLANGNIVACSTALNTCEQFSISGNVATRVGTEAFIDDSSLMRQPTRIMVVP